MEEEEKDWRRGTRVVLTDQPQRGVERANGRVPASSSQLDQPNRLRVRSTKYLCCSVRGGTGCGVRARYLGPIPAGPLPGGPRSHHHLTFSSAARQ